MFDLPPLLTACAGAATFGFASSLHCAAMCGPLASCGISLRKSRAHGAQLAFLYQSARAGAYSSVGALLGALGGLGSRFVDSPIQRALPFVLAATLIASALGLTKHVVKIPLLGKVVGSLSARVGGLPPFRRAMALGAITPLLPCGILFWMYASASVSGGWWQGAALMASFSLASAPALLAVQMTVGMATGRSNRWLQIAQTVLPLAAAAVVLYRGLLPVFDSSCH